MSSVSERIERALAAAGLTKVEAAERLGVSRSSIQSWTSGRYVPSQIHLRRIADLTNRYPEWFIDEATPIGNRLNEAIGSTQDAYTRFLDAPGVDWKSAYEVITEGRIPTDDEIVHWSSVLGVDSHWLSTGRRGGVPTFQADRGAARTDEPPNLARYLASSAGRDVRSELRLAPLADALRTTAPLVGDMPTPEDWHAVRRALEQGEKVREGMARHAVGPGTADDSDARRQAARDASPEGTTDVLVIDDKWERLSEATQKAAKESKG